MSSIKFSLIGYLTVHTPDINIIEFRRQEHYMSEFQETLFARATLPTVDIDEAQADTMTKIEEGQFSDVKATAITPAKLSHTISAFANTDGGELYIGIAEQN